MNGVPIPGESQPTLLLSGVDAVNEGVYSCRVSNKYVPLGFGRSATTG